MKTKWLLIAILFICVSFVPNQSAQAQVKYPNQPITFVIPFGPGATTDVCWRLLMEELKAELKVPMNAVNKTGAGGLAGADFVANSKPDGYTMFAANNTSMTVAPAVDPKAYRDLVPIAVVARQGVLVVTRSDHGVKTLEDMINMGKAKPDFLTAGTTGVTSTTYVDLALLEAATGAKFNHVPVPKSSEGTAMVLGGHMDFWWGSFSIVQNLLKAGRFRGIATCLPERNADFPDIPTFAEKGYPDVNLNLTMILYGPKGTPREVIKAWEDALNVVMKRPKMKPALEKLNFEVDFQLGSEKIRKDLDQMRTNVEKIVKAKGIKP